MHKFFKISVYTLAIAAVLIAGCKQPTVAAQNQGGGAKTFTVTFNLNGKEVKAGYSIPNPQQISDGGTATAPEKLTLADENYTFDYWASDSEGKNRYDFSTPVKSNIELYAIYAELVTVTLQYHNSQPDGTVKVKKDSMVDCVNPHKLDALFKHWSETENGAAVTKITAPITLHAVYHTIESSSMRIRGIQGTSHTSPKNNAAVTKIPGVVTAITYSKGKSNGFYMQDLDNDTDSATSEGIYVYSKEPDVKVGDAVLVSGKVAEFAYKPKNSQIQDLSITQIKTTKKDDVEVISHNNPLPEPVELKADAFTKEIFKADLNTLNPAEEVIDYYESLEGMRVKIVKPKVVAAPYKGTQYLAPSDTPTTWFTSHGGIILPDDYKKSTPCIRMYPFACFAEEKDAGVAAKEIGAGDCYDGDIIGVMGYSFSNYQIQLTKKLPTVTYHSGNSTPQTITADASKLNIVSYNLENFSKGNTKESQSSGKLAEERAEGFAKHLVDYMKAPDVICLIEIQDDNGEKKDEVVTATETLALLIEKIKKQPGNYDYAPVNIDPQVSSDPTKSSVDGGAPGANIRCCYLYRTDRIELAADTDNDVTNSTHATEAEIQSDGLKLTQNPARIGTTGDTFKNTRKSLVAHFKFKAGINDGKDFFVINNHLSSKRGDQPVWGCNQPAVRNSETNRHKQAEAVVEFIKNVKAKKSNAAIISVGDYNDFWFSDTIKKFKEADMKNVIEEFAENERYTYVYNGHFQTLDNILVTKNITIHNPVVLHVNAEIPATTRLSDHDPVYVQLSW
ncbi:MAG: InlB B-repeat-containing protein [Treponema sp.]